MNKKTALRLTGFLGAVGLTAALTGLAVAGTGAYFTDSKPGVLTGTSGHLTLNVSDTSLNLTNLVPGVDQTADVAYNVDTSTPSDVWVVFDPTDTGVAAFTGSDGLGRYGHFAISNNGGGAIFQSYNLRTGPADQSCGVNANGGGGSTQKATGVNDAPPYCPVPNAIKVASNLTSGQGGTIHLKFGITGRAVAQNSSWAYVPFKVVATQAGIRPDAANY